MKQASRLFISTLLLTLLIPLNSFAKETGTLIFDGDNWPNIYINKFHWNYAGVVHNEKKIKAISTSLKKQLFSSKTNNPFKVIYSDIYRPENIRKIRKLTQKKCPFHGLKLIDLDNNPKTTEWLIISSEQCLYDQDKPVKGLQYTSDDYYSGSTGQHNWILQKDTKGQYRVIVESDNSIWIYGKDSRYKTNTLETTLLLGRINRTNKTLCGAAEIIWQYKKGQLYPVKAKADAIGCGFYFGKIRDTALIVTDFYPSGDTLLHNISEDDWVFYRKLPHVQKQADRLLAYLQKVLSGEQPELLAKDLLLDEYPPKTDFIDYRKSHQTDKQSKQQKTQAGQFSTEEMKALEQLLSQ